jgi:ATP-dependent DNA ligase
MRTVRPSGFVQPCRPTKAARPPSGPQWVHEIKFDGFRLMVRREGSRVRCFTRGGYDWADRFPAIVDAAKSIRADEQCSIGTTSCTRLTGSIGAE